MTALTSPASRSVSSMRVPVRARMCSKNCPVSTLGKKFLPSVSVSSHEPTQKPRKIMRERLAMFKTACQQSAIAVAKTVEALFKAVLEFRTNGRIQRGTLEWSPCPPCSLTPR
jgi:hypothetical protein